MIIVTLGGIVKKVFRRKPVKVIELKALISQAFRDIDVNWNLCVTVCYKVWSRF